jgi:hypothetical protein
MEVTGPAVLLRSVLPSNASWHRSSRAAMVLLLAAGGNKIKIFFDSALQEELGCVGHVLLDCQLGPVAK